MDNGFQCQWRDLQDIPCLYICCTLRGMQGHCMKEHSWVNKQKRGGNMRGKEKQTPNKLWIDGQICQRFFEAARWKRYFAVTQDGILLPPPPPPPLPLLAEEAAGRMQLQEPAYHPFFRQQEEGLQLSDQTAAEQANRVQGFEDHRSTVVPWLKITGIAEHIRGLQKDEIQAAIAFPSANEDSILPTILDEMEQILQTAHR